METAIELKTLSQAAGDLQRLQAVLDSAPDYFERITGSPAEPREAENAYFELPLGKSLDDKSLYGVYQDQEMVGCVDVLRGFPTEEVAVIGLLLISEASQGLGLGRLAFEASRRPISDLALDPQAAYRSHRVQRHRLAVLGEDGICPDWRGSPVCFRERSVDDDRPGERPSIGNV